MATTVYAKTVEYRLGGKATGKLKYVSYFVMIEVVNEITKIAIPGMDGRVRGVIQQTHTAEEAKAEAAALATASGATLGEHEVLVTHWK